MTNTEKQNFNRRVAREVRRILIDKGSNINTIDTAAPESIASRVHDFIDTYDSPQGSRAWSELMNGNPERILEWFYICDNPLPRYGGEIEGFPEEFVKLLLKEQFRAENTVDIRVFENNKMAQLDDGGFDHSRVYGCTTLELSRALSKKEFGFITSKYERVDPEIFFDREVGSVNTDYTFDDTDIIGQISGYPRNVVVSMINNQLAQTGVADITVFQAHAAANKSAGGFNFQDTPEGAEHWCNIDAGDFSVHNEVTDSYVSKPKKKINRAKRAYDGKVKDYHGETQDESKCIKIRDFWILKENAVYMPDKTFEAPEFSFEYRGESYSMYDEDFVYTKSSKFIPKSECVFLEEEGQYEIKDNAIQLWLDYEIDETRPQTPSGKWISRELMNKSNKYKKITHGMAAGYAVLKSYTTHCYDIDAHALLCEAFYCNLNGNYYLDKDLAPEPLTLAHIHDYHRSPDILDMSDNSLLKIGFEIEKVSFNGRRESGQKVSEHAIFKGLETDSSCGVEAITNILPLGLKGSSEESKVFNLMDDAAPIIDEEDVDSSCGGHISISCKGMTANELFLRMRESMSVVYAIFRSRLNNQYCDSNHRIEAHKNKKYSPITIKSKWNTVEIRIPSRVRNTEQLKLRYQLMAVLADHSVNTNGDFKKLLKRVKPILMEMYKGKSKKVSMLLGLAKHFRTYILTNKVHEDVSEYVCEYSDADETPAPQTFAPFEYVESASNNPNGQESEEPSRRTISGGEWYTIPTPTFTYTDASSSSGSISSNSGSITYQDFPY